MTMRFSYSLELKKAKLMLYRLKIDMKNQPQNKETILKKIKQWEDHIQRLQKVIDDGADPGPRTI